MLKTPRQLWTPSDFFKEQANLTSYKDWLLETYQLPFNNYRDLWQWSVDEPEDFWESIWRYFNVQSASPYSSILDSQEMPGTRWFEGSTLNYAEHIFRNATSRQPAILFQSENEPLAEISWQELKEQVARLAGYLRSQGVQAGDRVVAFIPNIPEATIGFLAACSLGAVWSSCSPDFGADSVIDRFQQIAPKILIAVDGYQYNGKPYDKTAVVQELSERLPSLQQIIAIPYLNKHAVFSGLPNKVVWTDALSNKETDLQFTAVPFSHPIWVLYSSGTTGIPKAITHSQGGVLLEHLKYVAFHNDVHPGERFFWYSTTGWMMWNYVQATLLLGATIVLYDGSPAYPDISALWQLTEQAGIHHFGTSAPFLVACMKQGLQAGQAFDLGSLRSISSTGAPLPPEAFDYVYEQIKKDVWLVSMSGGTDVCSAFVGGNPWEPVFEGEIQCRALGCALYAYDESGHPVNDTVGEMVITKPMPSMPIYFWNDEGMERYKESYFAMYSGVWRHGDWVRITLRNSIVIYGRSDATLNRQGVRIGTAEIYRCLNNIEQIKDSLIVNLELSGGRHYMPLFVVLQEGVQLDDQLMQQIKQHLRQDYSPRHVPDEILQIEEVPYTISGKKLEAPVKKILMGIPLASAANKDAMRNPWALDYFKKLAERLER